MTTVFIYQDAKAVSPDAAAQHEMGWRLLREGMRRLGIEGCPCYAGDKPAFLPPNGFYFNISHSGNHAAAVLSEYPVGIDVERRRAVLRSVWRNVLSGEERRFLEEQEDPEKGFLRFWTLKESYGKLFGFGIGYPMRETEFDLRHGEVVASRPENRAVLSRRISCSDARVDCFQWEEPDWVLSLCILGKRREIPRLVRLTALPEACGSADGKSLKNE